MKPKPKPPAVTVDDGAPIEPEVVQMPFGWRPRYDLGEQLPGSDAPPCRDPNAPHKPN